MQKRLKEIEQEKIELRSKIENDTEQKLNLEEIRNKVDLLINEETELRAKIDLANKINNNKIVAKTITEGEKNMNDMLDTIEYRSAFKNYVVSGKMAEEYRATSLKSGNSAVIPPTVLNKIVEKLESYGNLWNLVSKTSYASGLAIPTSSMGLVATWVAEGAGSTNQAVTSGQVVFGAYKLQCRVAVSDTLHVQALSAFEEAIINNISKAMIKAIETSIVSGNGVGQMSGIINETVPADRVVKVSTVGWDTVTDIESAIPEAYENNTVLVMSKKTYMTFEAMTDSAGQPIARLNIGLNGKPERTIYGRTVVLTDTLPSFATASTDDVIAFAFDMSNFVVNSALDITMRTYVDENTDDTITKATAIMDGKVVDGNGLVLIKKA